ncbi:uncharacterized protein LOC106058346 [Biomphalaria glabrata]|uniref:Uncharacterized protein LOC106058346 n=1 Tax=Biomphalaria glabrata TaxID=6526 RepID=A0A9U8E3H3_BIOGL|nr:uncharacterized protein LOC106058346 [Biomphalaria glabrata]
MEQWATVLLFLKTVLLIIPAHSRRISLNKLNVTVGDVTTTTITLFWDYLEEIDLNDDIYMYVTYNKQTILPHNDNNDCSLIIKMCVLRNLHPGTTYDVQLQIGARGGNDSLQSFKVATLTLHEKAPPELSWWLIYVMTPPLAVIVLVLVIILLCRICRCCCWGQHSINESNGTRSVESRTTNEWIQNTVKTMPSATPAGYDQPRTHCSNQSEDNSLLLKTTPILPIKSRQALKNTGSFRCGKQAPLSSPPSVPDLYVNASSGQQPAPSELYANSSPVDLHTPHGEVRRGVQNSSEFVTYSNTDDLNQMLGNARKMFPLL